MSKEPPEPPTNVEMRRATKAADSSDREKRRTTKAADSSDREKRRTTKTADSIEHVLMLA